MDAQLQVSTKHYALLKKPNTAVVMAAKVGRLDAITRKIFSSMLYAAQQVLIKKKLLNEIHEATEYFVSPLRDLMLAVGEDPKTRYTCVKEAVKSMVGTTVEWQSPDAKSDLNWGVMTLVSACDVSVVKGVAMLSWAFPPPILFALRDTKSGFSLIQLEELANLKTYAAIALYEICAKYADNPSHKTNQREPEWWVKSLTDSNRRHRPRKQLEKGQIGPLDSLAYIRPWKNFKPDNVIPAIEEINSNTRLNIKLLEVTEGKRIAFVQFEVMRKKKSNQERVEYTPEAKDLMIQALECGVSDDIIKTYLRENASITNLKICLMKLRLRIEKEEEDPVNNPGAYFRYLVRNIDVSVREKEPGNSPTAPLEEAETECLTPTLESPGKGPLALGVGEDIALTPQQVEDSLFKTYFFNLPDDVKAIHLNELRDSLKLKNMLTPISLRKIIAKEWESPVIFFLLKELIKKKVSNPFNQMY